MEVVDGVFLLVAVVLTIITGPFAVVVVVVVVDVLPLRISSKRCTAFRKRAWNFPSPSKVAIISLSVSTDVQVVIECKSSSVMSGNFLKEALVPGVNAETTDVGLCLLLVRVDFGENN